MRKARLQRLCNARGVQLLDSEGTVIVKAPQGKMFSAYGVSELEINEIPHGYMELAYDRVATFINAGLIDQPN
jgi:hypothetical protein